MALLIPANPRFLSSPGLLSCFPSYTSMASVSEHSRVFCRVSSPGARCIFSQNSHNYGARRISIKQRRTRELKASTATEKLNSDDDEDGPSLMTEEERYEWRSKIRQVIDTNPDVEEEMDATEKNKVIQKLLADYPLVMNEEDPDWPEDADGRGFGMDQFFNKVTIKNVKKKKNDDDDDDDNENEIVWQDDDYIKPIKDITTAEWEEAVFKDISPLVVLVHHRYRRPKENDKFRNELEKAVQIIWNCRLPSPRCVAVDAVVERDLVAALKVSDFPEMIFTKTGKILYREKGHRTADELSKIMAFFYYGATKPSCLNNIEKGQEAIPYAPISSHS